MDEIVHLNFERLEEKIDAILEQTTKTNGRVMDLEKKVSVLEMFKVQLMAIIMGASAVITLLWTVATKLINFSFNIK